MASELRKRLGAKLLLDREQEKDWSRLEAATRVGVDSGVIRRIELGLNYKIDAAEAYARTLTAKTAIVVNAGVTQDVYERLVLELRDWKRFALVTDPLQADLTITIDGQNTIGTNVVVPVRAIAYTLSFKQGETVLYRDALKGCCSLKAMTRKTLEKLDKRMRQ